MAYKKEKSAEQSMYKEAAIALAEFLSLSLNHLSTYLPDKELKKRLQAISGSVRQAGTVRDISDVKDRYKKVLRKADQLAEQAEKKEKRAEAKKAEEKKAGLVQPKPPPVRREPAPMTAPPPDPPHSDMVSIDGEEILTRSAEIISKLLKALEGGSMDANSGRKIEALMARLPSIKDMGEWREFESGVKEAVYQRTFMEERMGTLYQEAFNSMLEGLLLWVDKNTIIERRVQKALDPKTRSSDPWVLKDLAGGVKSFLFTKRQEVFVLGREREKLKSVIVSMVKMVQDVAQKNNLFIEGMGRHVEDLERVEDLRDIEKIKTNIVHEVGQLRKKTDTIEGEIRGLKKKLLSARSAIRSMEEELTEAKKAGLRDPLTGTFSRAAFEERLEVAVSITGKTGDPFGLIFLDLDRFNSINMNYGKPVGDEVLKALCNDITEEMGEGGFLARFGANAFAVILNEVEGDSLKDVAEKLRDAIRHHEFVLKSRKISLTASLIAAKVGKGDSAQLVMERVQGLMSDLKQHGGNRCAFDSLK